MHIERGSEMHLNAKCEQGHRFGRVMRVAANVDWSVIKGFIHLFSHVIVTKLLG